MRLFIMRHGQAEPRATSDAERALDAVGEAEAGRVAARLAQRVATVDAIWSSPYRRARQTAEAVAAALGCAVSIRDDLVPEAPPTRIADALGELADDDTALVLVSHMPLVARLNGWLLSATRDSDAEVALATAGVAELTATIPQPGCFRLVRVRDPQAW